MSDEWNELCREKAKNWLHEVAHASKAIDSCRLEQQKEREAYDMMKAIAYDSEGNGSGMLHGDDSIANHIIHLQETVQKLQEYDAEYSELIRNAREVFHKLYCHPCATTIMTSHYLMGASWESMSRPIDRGGIGYSIRQIKRIANDATLECYTLMPLEWRLKIPRADE